MNEKSRHTYDVLMANPSLVWLLILSILSIALVRLYKYCVVREVETNGRVVTRYRLPFFEPYLGNSLFPTTGIKARRVRCRWNKANSSNPISLSLKSKRWLSSIYDVQDTAFGLVLGATGLFLLSRGSQLLASGSTKLARHWSLSMILIGLLGIVLGIVYVACRQSRNPFRDG